MLESLLVIYRPEFWAGPAWPAALQVSRPLRLPHLDSNVDYQGSEMLPRWCLCWRHSPATGLESVIILTSPLHALG